jgi:hypothetical protein
VPWKKICATSVNFKTLTKVNNRPNGKNSPNLVTLWGGGHKRGINENVDIW